MTKHKDEGRTCQNCDGYGIIEGRFCDCSLGQMALRDALTRGEHVAVAYNHETGNKESFLDRKHNTMPTAAAQVSGEAEELAREIVLEVCRATLLETATELSPSAEPIIDRVAALLRSRMERAELFGRALIVLKGLNLAVDWELAPPIKKEIAAICAEFEALPSALDTEEK